VATAVALAAAGGLLARPAESHSNMMMSFSDLAAAMSHLPMRTRQYKTRDLVSDLDVIPDDELPDGRFACARILLAHIV
jgi:hypothetical protein